MRLTSRIYAHYLLWQSLEEDSEHKASLLSSLNQSPIEVSISDGIQRKEILSVIEYLQKDNEDTDNLANNQLPVIAGDTLKIFLNDSYFLFIQEIERDIDTIYKECDTSKEITIKSLQCLLRKIQWKVKES